MSLDWQLSDIEDYETLCWLPDPDNTDQAGDGKRLNPVTHALILSTLSVGLGEITRDNALKFYTRLSMIERLHGSYLREYDASLDHGVPRFITATEVRAHIGLRTNVFPNVTDAAWSTRLLRNYSDDVRSRWKAETVVDA